MKVSHHWLKRAYFSDDLNTPEEIAEVLGTQIFEFEGSEIYEQGGNHDGVDTILDFDVLPNRAHDCLSHRGIAREIKVLFNREDYHERDQVVERCKQSPMLQKAASSDRQITTEIENTELCRRHVTRVIENITVEESPNWLRWLLESLGQRSINNVVDITNYVMFSIGQPNHVFDLDKLAGDTIFIRGAKDGEQVTTLDKKELTLQEGDLVLADEEAALDIAGIKGGIKADLTNTTTNIVLSVANFHPTHIRKTARRTGVLTDASKRFENEPTAELCSEAIEMVTTLVVALAGTDNTKIGEVVDEYPVKPEQKTVKVHLDDINTRLGSSMSNADVSAIFAKFGFGYKEENNLFEVVVPVYRFDLNIKEDLIEEVGRVYNYSKLENKNTDEIPYTPKTSSQFEYLNRLRNEFLGRGFSEVITYTFVNEGDLQMKNALASDKSYARPTMVNNIEEALEKNARNAALFGEDQIRIFEIGSIFPGGEEYMALCVGLDPITKKARNKGTVAELEVLIDEIEKIVGVELANFVTKRGTLTLEINMTEAIAKAQELDSHDSLASVKISDAKFTEFSQFPFITRDIAVWLPGDTQPEELEFILKEQSGDLLVREPQLVDRFEKEGRVSYAYRLVFQAMDRTLTDEEIQPLTDGIYKTLEEKGWDVR